AYQRVRVALATQGGGAWKPGHCGCVLADDSAADAQRDEFADQNALLDAEGRLREGAGWGHGSRRSSRPLEHQRTDPQTDIRTPSNGQDESIYHPGVREGRDVAPSPDSLTVNYPNGSFSTNYAAVAYFYRRIGLGPGADLGATPARWFLLGGLGGEWHRFAWPGGNIPEPLQGSYGLDRYFAVLEYERRVDGLAGSRAVRGALQRRERGSPRTKAPAGAMSSSSRISRSRSSISSVRDPGPINSNSKPR